MSVRQFAVLVLALGGMLAPAHRPSATDPAVADQVRGSATAPDLEAAAGPRPVGAVAAVAGRSTADEPLAAPGREDWSQIRGLMATGRYHAAPVGRSGQPALLEAANPAQGDVTTFRPEAIEIAPRSQAGTDWRLGVRVTGFGREGDVRPLPGARPASEKERVQQRRGPVTEWYVNRPGNRRLHRHRRGPGFSEGRERLDHTIEKGASSVFRHRVLILSGLFSAEKAETAWKALVAEYAEQNRPPAARTAAAATARPALPAPT